MKKIVSLRIPATLSGTDALSGIARKPNIPMQLLSFDIDGTLIDAPDRPTTTFNEAWQQIPADKKPVLVYNSGRSLASIQSLIDADVLPKPDFIISAVGTRIVRYAGDQVNAYQSHIANRHWNPETVTRIVDQLPFRADMTLQPARDLSDTKISYYYDNAPETALDLLNQTLRNHDIHANVIYSTNHDLDIIPENANKGKAVFWLASALGFKPEEIVVGGDSGNDLAMFATPELAGTVNGIVVGNASLSLKNATQTGNIFQATGTAANGILEGLKRLGVLG